MQPKNIDEKGSVRLLERLSADWGAKLGAIARCVPSKITSTGHSRPATAGGIQLALD